MEKDIEGWNTALTNAMAAVLYGFWWAARRWAPFLTPPLSICASSLPWEPPGMKGGVGIAPLLLGLLSVFLKKSIWRNSSHVGSPDPKQASHLLPLLAMCPWAGHFTSHGFSCSADLVEKIISGHLPCDIARGLNKILCVKSLVQSQPFCLCSW